MKHSFTVFIALILCTVFLSASVVTDDTFSLLIKRIEDYVKANPQEKVHLHLDKPYYAVGDDIWFKAYIVDTRNSAPSTVSAALYVELIDERDSIRKQLKLPVAYGLTWGDFQLPDSLSEGNYRIRAYTQLMRNMGPEFFFDKTIKVGNSWSSKLFTTTRYQYDKDQDGNPHVNANIRFTDRDNKPYANTEVSYELQMGGKAVAKGKVKTDPSGNAMIGLSKLKELSGGQARIVTSMLLPSKQKVRKSIPLTALSNEVDVQFFPEGGQLVQGLPSRIGVKAVGANGLGRDVEGAVLDEDGTSIVTFKTLKLGMGSLSLTPQPGKKYTAKVKFADGSERSFPLPAAASSGYTLQVKNSSTDQILVKMMCSADLLNKGELKFIARHQRKVYMVSRVATNKQIATAVIPKRSLPAGIIQLTLFSPDNQPVSERLVFVHHPEELINTKLTTDKKSYTPRQSVKLDLVALTDDKPVQGSFSVSITNTSSVIPDEDNESNILTSLLLTSDLTGYVEKPNTYFTSDSKETMEALDNLMLTQGWRRFVWEDFNAEPSPALSFAPEKSLTISGTVKLNNKTVVPNARVTLLTSKGSFSSLDTLTNEEGRFVFDRLNFPDSTKFVIQARYGKNKKFVEIEIDQVPGQRVTTNKNTGDVEVNVNEAIESYLTKSESFFDHQVKRGFLSKAIQLDEVKIRVVKPNPAPNSANLNGPGRADFVFSQEDLENSSSLMMLLIGRVPGIRFIGGVPHLTRSMNTSFSGLVPMRILLDGMQMGEEMMIEDLIITDIESVEVLRSGHFTAMYGQRGGGGVILITTKSGRGGTVNNYAPGLITYQPKGFAAIREFYSPKYETKDSPGGADLRTTIYWNPNVSTNAEGKGSFSFYTADEPGDYRVVIEGIEKNGKLAREVFTYVVKHQI